MSELVLNDPGTSWFEFDRVLPIDLRQSYVGMNNIDGDLLPLPGPTCIENAGDEWPNVEDSGAQVGGTTDNPPKSAFELAVEAAKRQAEEEFDRATKAASQVREEMGLNEDTDYLPLPGPVCDENTAENETTSDPDDVLPLPVMNFKE